RSRSRPRRLFCRAPRIRITLSVIGCVRGVGETARAAQPSPVHNTSSNQEGRSGCPAATLFAAESRLDSRSYWAPFGRGPSGRSVAAGQPLLPASADDSAAANVDTAGLFEPVPMFRSVRFYTVLSPWPDSEQALSERLATAAFRPCGPYSERSSGFEPPADGVSVLARRVAGADLLKLRSQVRVLPAAAVNEALEARIEEYRGRMGEEPGRRMKRKLKQQTRDELLPKA